SFQLLPSFCLFLQNFCSNSTVLRTQTACHSCSISMFVPCPTGFRRSPGSLTLFTVWVLCRYQIRTSSLQLAVSGCSFQCFQQVEVKSCCPGYWGPDCMECPDRADGPCSGRGVCSDGSGTCSCVHGLCGSGLKGDGRCTCFSGYRGPRCDQELPECAALSCQQNARCMEEALTGQLVCQCLPGYEKSGSQSKNPCLRPVCHSWASCAHTGPDQHHCTCNPGYSGDGQVCMAVDPCQTQNGGCSARTTRCIYDGPGKSHCECLPGFETLADGSCNLKDVCKPDSCHQNANCSTVEPGRVRSVPSALLYLTVTCLLT
uniref:EGF-like domain-containing protein n=1 Tax=Poecilia reticulata TaxID=8081 RepID=A0A3P9Q2P0_POERE